MGVDDSETDPRVDAAGCWDNGLDGGAVAGVAGGARVEAERRWLDEERSEGDALSVCKGKTNFP